MKLENRTVLITGGSDGIGLETAKLFVENGANVIITGRGKSKLDKAVKEIGVNATAIQSDASNLNDLDLLYQTIVEQYKKIDGLFVNAGMVIGSHISEVTEQQFDEQITLNLKGAYFTVQKALPLLKDQSVIVLNASTAGIIGIKGLSVYSATKAAMINLAKTLAADLAERQIRVNAISPSYTATPLALELNQGNIENVNAMIPFQQRFAEPIEMAKTVLYLMSDDTSYMTGQNIIVDAGLTPSAKPPPKAVRIAKAMPLQEL